jgi:D-3-phosphoglycerate dehydrogenase
MKILLLEGVHERAVENFARHGYTTIERHKKALDGEELKAALAGVHFVGIRSRTRLTAAAMAGSRKLMAIGAFCIGTNQVDLDAAMMRGIPVFNAPFSNTRSVAELVLAEITSCAASPPRTPSCTAGCGPSRRTTRARCGARRSASWATATSAPSSR